MKYDVMQNGSLWWVARSDGTVVPDGGTEAEANIIAFALNAVAEGKRLSCFRDDEPTQIWAYFGPTEGVAP